MKKLISFFIVAVIVLSVALVACGQKKAASSQQAIETAKGMESVDRQADYLINQAELFYSSNEYQDAVSSLQYVLNNLDKDSQEAKDLLEKAKADMTGAVSDMLKGKNK